MFLPRCGHGYTVTGVKIDRRGGGVGHANAPDRGGPRRALIMVTMAAKTRRIPYKTARSFDLPGVVGKRDQPILQQRGLATFSDRRQGLGASVLNKGIWYSGRLI